MIINETVGNFIEKLNNVDFGGNVYFVNKNIELQPNYLEKVKLLHCDYEFIGYVITDVDHRYVVIKLKGRKDYEILKLSLTTLLGYKVLYMDNRIIYHDSYFDVIIDLIKESLLKMMLN